MAERQPISAKDLAVNGHDLMAVGIKAGPNMGKVFSELVQIVIESPEMNTREKLLAEAERIYIAIRKC